MKQLIAFGISVVGFALIATLMMKGIIPQYVGVIAIPVEIIVGGSITALLGKGLTK